MRMIITMVVSHSLMLIITAAAAFVFGANVNEKTSDHQQAPVDLSLYPSQDNIGIDGKFLRVVLGNVPPYVNVTRNSTGHITKLEGLTLLVLDWLSSALHFKYIFLPDDIPGFEPNSAGKGQMAFIFEGNAEISLGPAVMNAKRLQYLNFIHPFAIGQFGFLIPKPGSQVNVAAVWEPFQKQIWIFLFISILAAIMFLYGISYGASNIFIANTSEFRVISGKSFEDVVKTCEYVIGILFSQGVMVHKDSSLSQKLAIRILAGAWCISCFILITAYSSVLISFVTSPYYKPLINSIYDFPKNAEIKITVDKGKYPDILFTNADGGIFKYLGDQLRRNPELRCSESGRCLSQVRNGSHVYTQLDQILENIIGIDLKQTGRCGFTIAKEYYSYFSVALPIAKQMEVEFFNRGMMKAHEGGFINLWTKRYVADASRCLNNINKEKSDIISLTIDGLSGAFVGIAFGFGLSVLILVFEITFKHCRNKQIHNI